MPAATTAATAVATPIPIRVLRLIAMFVVSFLMIRPPQPR